MNVALRVDVSDASATAVSAAAVPTQQAEHFLGAGGIFLAEALVKISTVSRLIHREHFATAAGCGPLRCAVDDLVDGSAGLCGRDIDDVAPTSTVNKMVEAHPVD